MSHGDFLTRHGHAQPLSARSPPSPRRRRQPRTQFDQLVSAKLNVKHSDLRIAAIALQLGATVVTRNRRDFARVPGLMIEDWSV